jgi:hypothetical protein
MLREPSSCSTVACSVRLGGEHLHRHDENGKRDQPDHFF